MNYEFSYSAFVAGFFVLLAGVALVRWHRTIANNLGSGLASYDRFRMWAFIVCGFGLLLMLNIPSFLLYMFLSRYFIF